MATARRAPVLIPVALAALALSAAVFFACGAFVGNSAPAVGTSLRAASAGQTALHGLPVGLVEGSSVSMSLAVTTAAWWANIVLLIIPLTFLIILYLQSERTLAEDRQKK
eukprot:CAMPEP_0115501916 /NCGR_PEP_ID=MMETSP0271-20121206/68655_1 /TAXON_ID=71861 /ORGANISM="Scrippsiella trochoidea, Strain CCMP3099" /LENGTH=109 /DNA_ID=CAMNT_0002930887 /DNA_START=87 /DNA_END=416 /DNA_ORIENTATION=+